MKHKPYFLNLVLVLLWAVQLAACLLCRTFFPANILPPMDIPLLLGVSLAALLLEHYLAPGAQRAWAAMAGLAALTFGLLPLCAGATDGLMALKLAGIGGLTFVISTMLFDSMLCRLSSGPRTKAAPVIAAFGLFLAGQCFTNIFF